MPNPPFSQFSSEGRFMKHIAMVCLLMMSFSCLTFSQVDTSGTKVPEFSISGGTAFPYLPYPFKDFWKAGFGVGGGYGYVFPPGGWGYGTISGAIEYTHFPFNTENFIKKMGLGSNSVVDGGATDAITVLATVKGAFASTEKSIAPYFLIGLGYMNVMSGAVTVNGSASLPKTTKSGLAYSLGAGVDIPASERVKVFVEGKFCMGLTSEPGRQYFPIGLGLRFKP